MLRLFGKIGNGLELLAIFAEKIHDTCLKGF